MNINLYYKYLLPWTSGPLRHDVEERRMTASTPPFAFEEGDVVTMRELGQNAAKTIDRINESGRPALVTRHGRPQAAIIPLANAHIATTVLAHPDSALRKSVVAAEEEMASEGAVSSADVAKSLGLEPQE
ncbi:type II toxin-antitoxin system Phd/YefM family antitoxin [Streptomyces sp. HNM0663]|uniref:Antitoxin n=1 Tax=Streptomyces chengmaiensis TaxID=3040919 RepID=A0ABT6HIS9_9ACTN|nr:type II toxin-antitoxin system Phd/YefM family antitoxin [Streptomyces chengmaiensis]MDH2388583.1 type II toxin-antitoxin system Phd/YefM family antitoxin [Streptomyces chengmaiensis]